MAQISLRIKVNEGADRLISFEADKIVNNVSTLIEDWNMVTKNAGVNGKSFATGFLSLKDGFVGGNSAKLQSEIDKYNGFMFGATSSNANYELKLTLSGENLDKLIIIGDKAANQYPIRAILDEGTDYEKVIYSDDVIWAIKFEQESATHTIKFTTWNRANYNACFTTIKEMLKYLDLNNAYIDNLESLGQTTTTPSEIQYGVLASSGNVLISDLDGELLDYIEDGIIEDSNLPVELYINGKLIRSHITIDSRYNEQNKQLSLQLTNGIERLKNLNVDEYIDGSHTGTKVSFYQLISIVVSNTMSLSSDSSEFIAFMNHLTKNYVLISDLNGNYDDDEEITIEDYLKRIIINDGTAYVTKSSLYEFLDKIANATQLNLIEDSDGNAMYVSARPHLLGNDDKISIKPYNQIEIFRELIVKNKYDVVTFNNNEVTSDFSDLANINASFRDKNNVFTLNSLDSAKIVRGNDNTPYLCFFVTINSSNNIKSNTIKSISIETDDSEQYVTVDDVYAYSSIFSYTSNQKASTNITYFDKSSLSKDELIDTNKDYSGFINNLNAGCTELSIYTTLNTITFAVKEELIYELDPTTLNNITIAIRPRRIIRKTTPSSYGTGKREYNFNVDNEFIGSNIKFYNSDNSNYTELYNILFNNILVDYEKGIQTATVSTMCTDYYDTNGNLIKNYNVGDVIQETDVVKVDNDYNGNVLYKYSNGDDMYFRVTGSKIRYDGSAPYIDLELQENVYYREETPEINYDFFIFSRDSQDNLFISLSTLGKQQDIIYVPSVDQNKKTIYGISNFSYANYKKINIPKTIKEISSSAFSNCPNLEEIHYDAIDCEYTGIGTGAFIGSGYNKSTLKLIIGKYVEKIPNSLFSYGSISDGYTSYLTDIEFEVISNLVEIGEYAFYRCTSLKSDIYMPNSVTNIGKYAFYLCSNIKSIVLANNIENVNEYTFYGCSELRTITLPSMLKNIKQGAFEQCVRLWNLEIPNSVISIGALAFRNCANIVKITLGSSLTTIGSNAFKDCMKVMEIRNLSQLNIIAELFYGNSELYAKYVYTDIEDSRLSIKNNFVLYYEENASVVDLVEYIGSNNELYLGNSFTINSQEKNYRIYAHAFSYNNDLTFVSFHNRTINTSILDFAFSNCKNLQNVELPNILNIISPNLFYGCESINNVEIPSSVNSIYSFAFNDCSSLTNLIVNRTTPPNLNNTNAISTATTTIKVPVASVNAYKTATNWSNFADIIIGLTEQIIDTQITSGSEIEVQLDSNINGIKIKFALNIDGTMYVSEYYEMQAEEFDEGYEVNFHNVSFLPQGYYKLHVTNNNSIPVTLEYIEYIER